MSLQVAQTDTSTGAVYAVAVVRIDDARVQFAQNSVTLVLNTYCTLDAAAANLKPVLPAVAFQLTQDELVALRTAFRQFLYSLPRLRAMFPGAIDV